MESTAGRNVRACTGTRRHPDQSATALRWTRRVLGVLVLMLPLAGCTTSVTPPRVQEPAAVVFIADYGKHSSLLLPRGDGTLREYAYGEHDWFARGLDSPLRGPGVMLGGGGGTLGRRDVEAPVPGASARSQSDALRAGLGLEEVHPLTVDAQSVADLLRMLDEQFASAEAQQAFNPRNGLTFVPHPRAYSMSYHCNSAVGEWLRALGCQVRSVQMIASYRVEQPGDG